MNIWTLNPTYPMNQIQTDLMMNPKPPTLYAIMNSIANYDTLEKTKIRNLAKATREKIFDFDYPLSSKVNKEDFECQILNHFIMRRIGQETFTAFQLFLENKLNEILPYYNIMFDSLADYNLFNDGEVITRNRTDNGTSTLNSANEMKSKYAEYPMNELSDIDDGKYVTNQTTNNGTNGTNGTSSNISRETETRSGIDKMDLYQKYLQTEKSKIMTLIYKDLNILFYGLAD
ncbi:MAG: hypothetical protein J6T10_21885 [Methanobrevibacter sp.]|nr:hypothetical protein [Methanobrevibacter sp.]